MQSIRYTIITNEEGEIVDMSIYDHLEDQLKDKKPEPIKKFHVQIINDYTPITAQPIKGLVYTEGFAKGNKGYVVSALTGMVTPVKVLKTIDIPIVAASSYGADTNNPNVFITGEFAIDDRLFIVHFVEDFDRTFNGTVSLPPHELLSIS